MKNPATGKGAVIKSIDVGGQAEKHGNVETGMAVLSINGIDVRGYSMKKIGSLLIQKEMVDFILGPKPNTSSNHSEGELGRAFAPSGDSVSVSDPAHAATPGTDSARVASTGDNSSSVLDAALDAVLDADTNADTKPPLWLHGELSQLEADDLILQQGTADGTFLVRESALREHDYILSVAFRDRVTNHLLVQDPETRCWTVHLIDHGGFSNLQQLIERLQRPHPTWPVPLGTPVAVGACKPIRSWQTPANPPASVASVASAATTQTSESPTCAECNTTGKDGANDTGDGNFYCNDCWASFDIDDHTSAVTSLQPPKTEEKTLREQRTAKELKLKEDAIHLEHLMKTVGVRIHTVENVHATSTSPAHVLEKARRRAAAYAALRADLDPTNPMVGVDCEGTGKATWTHVLNEGGCMMVQISTRRVCVVECITAMRCATATATINNFWLGDGLSDELRAILEDPGIMCVFCDAQGDLDAIAAETDPSETRQTLSVVPCQPASVLDVQAQLSHATNDPKKGGLAKVISFATGVNLKKQSFSTKQWWQLSSIEAMMSANGFVHYAAADAWGTWLAAEYMDDPKQGQYDFDALVEDVVTKGMVTTGMVTKDMAEDIPRNTPAPVPSSRTPALLSPGLFAQTGNVLDFPPPKSSPAVGMPVDIGIQQQQQQQHARRPPPGLLANASAGDVRERLTAAQGAEIHHLSTGALANEESSSDRLASQNNIRALLAMAVADFKPAEAEAHDAHVAVKLPDAEPHAQDTTPQWLLETVPSMEERAKLSPAFIASATLSASEGACIPTDLLEALLKCRANDIAALLSTDQPTHMASAHGTTVPQFYALLEKLLARKQFQQQHPKRFKKSKLRKGEKKRLKTPVSSLHTLAPDLLLLPYVSEPTASSYMSAGTTALPLITPSMPIYSRKG